MAEDESPIDVALAAMNADPELTRATIMKWAVSTVALQDIVRAQKKSEVDWTDVAAAATRWLDAYGKRSGKFADHRDAMLRLSHTAAPARAPRPARSAADALDQRFASFTQRYGLLFLRVSLGVVFVWFGALKPLGLSPADDLVTKTVTWFPPEIFIPFLGAWEVAIGLCLLYRPLVRVALVLLFLQMPGTAMPLVLLPDVCFTHFPYALTLEGQYIIKNLTLVSAGLVVGSTMRWGKTRAEQERVTQVF